MKSAIAQGFALTAVALAGLLTAHPASAATPGDAPVKTVVVRYQDLDLAQPADARKLYRRITRAARVACDDSPESNLGRLRMYKSCMREAITSAVAQVKSPQLTSIYRAEIHRTSRS